MEGRLDVNYNFLNALNNKTNYAAQDAVKQNAIRYAEDLNNAKEKDFQNALQQQQQIDEAQAKLAAVPILENDRTKLQKENAASYKPIADLIVKYNGDVNKLFQSDEGRMAASKYIGQIKSNPNISKYMNAAQVQKMYEDAEGKGMAGLPIWREETGKSYTPQEQLAAYQSGELPDIKFNGVVKPKEFDVVKYFSNIYPQTNSNDEYYKALSEGKRLAVSPELAASETINHSYPMVRKGSKEYETLYGEALSHYKNEPPIYWKVPNFQDPIEKAATTKAMNDRGYYLSLRKTVDNENKQTAANNSTYSGIEQPQPVSVTWDLPNGQQTQVSEMQLAMPLLKVKSIPVTPNYVFVPTSKTVTTNTTTGKDEIVNSPWRVARNESWVIPQDYKLALKPVDATGTPIITEDASGLSGKQAVGKAVFVIGVKPKTGELGYIPFNQVRPTMAAKGGLKTYEEAKSLFTDDTQQPEEQAPTAEPSTPTQAAQPTQQVNLRAKYNY